MADEVTVIEHQYPSNPHIVRTMPPLAVQTLTVGGAVSSAFDKSTAVVTIRTSLACTIEFSALDGTDPDGNNGGEFPISADTDYTFGVRGGDKVIAVA